VKGAPASPALEDQLPARALFEGADELLVVAVEERQEREVFRVDPVDHAAVALACSRLRSRPARPRMAVTDSFMPAGVP